MWAKMGPEGRATAGAATWSHFRVCCCDFNAALALTRHCRTGQIQKYLFLFMVHAVVLFILPRTTTTATTTTTTPTTTTTETETSPLFAIEH